MQPFSTACVCGNSSVNSVKWRIQRELRSYDIGECTVCGVRRVLSLDDQYSELYRSGDYHTTDRTYDTGHKAHPDRFDHDYEVAKKRLAKLDRFRTLIPPAAKLLDVGCSNGALVAAALDENYFAFGCDLSLEGVPATKLKAGMDKFLHEGELWETGFYRRTLDVIMLNDVLEHMPDPVRAIKTAQGLLKRTGILVVEVPDMGCKEALEKGHEFHHVKPQEHIWYFTGNQLRALLERQGFNVVWMDTPIPGKVTAYAMPTTKVEQVTVYGPPGMGDILWTMCKLKAIREKEGPCKLKYVVCSDGETKLVTRAKDFMLLSDLIDEADFQPLPLPMSDLGNVDVTQPVYELYPNAWLEPQGKLLEDWHKELPADWVLGITIPAACEAQVRARLGYIDYVAVYTSSHVWHHGAAHPDWTTRDYADLFIMLHESGLKPVLLGADWDDGLPREIIGHIKDKGHNPNIVVNLCGKTTLPLAMAYMKLANCTLGIANGLPMYAAWMGYPTVMLWPTKGISKTQLQFTVEFSYNWTPPRVRNSGMYHPWAVGTFTAAMLCEGIKELARR